VSVRIHPSAIVDPTAQLGEDVEVGPFSIVGPGCELGDGCVIAARATLDRDVILGRNVRVGTGSVLGGEPQDLKFKGERTTVEIGDGTVIRECTTINRGTTHSFRTVVGREAFLMTYVHIAHDCLISDGVILANGVQLAGHVEIDEKAILSGLTAVHQFVRIGRYAFVGGCSRVSKDIPPFIKAVGNPVQLYGLNTVGLQRNGFSDDAIRELKQAYKVFFRSELNLRQAVRRMQETTDNSPEVRELIGFLDASGRRGVVV
jgi:UDP-N-acetylglucosamine acyltransferase